MPQKTPFTIAAEKLHAEGSRAAAERIRTEGRIVRKLIETGLEIAGAADLNDGEEWVIMRSTSVSDILAASFSTDEDRIRFRSPDGSMNAVFYLVYGNDGFDVISDYSDNDTAAKIMAIVSPYIDWLEDAPARRNRMEDGFGGYMSDAAARAHERRSLGSES